MWMARSFFDWQPEDVRSVFRQDSLLYQSAQVSFQSDIHPDSMLQWIASFKKHVPRKPSVTSLNRLKIYLNSASEKELIRIRGIGPTLAARIVDYRRKNGSFRRFKDLLNVKGIGEKKLRQIQPFIILGDSL
jgi:competence ComEA-like helix-hairpin-helix protein